MQSPHWPDWRYDLAALAEPLAAVSRAQGFLLGRLTGAGMTLRDEASLVALTEDVIQPSAIEDEMLNIRVCQSDAIRNANLFA